MPFRQEELLLPRSDQSLPDLAVRRADRLRRASRRGLGRRIDVPLPDRTRPHGGGRGEEHPCRRPGRAHPGGAVLLGRLQPRGRAARGDRLPSRDRRRSPRSGDRRRLRALASRCLPRAGRLRGADGARKRPRRRQRLPPGGPRLPVGRPHRDEERQLLPRHRERRALRDPASGGHSGRWRAGSPGDPALSRGGRLDLLGQGEVRRRGLPVLPRAGSRARRAPAGMGRRTARGHARASSRPAAARQGGVGAVRRGAPRSRQRRGHRRRRGDRSRRRRTGRRAQMVDGRHRPIREGSRGRIGGRSDRARGRGRARRPRPRRQAH